MKLPFTLGLRRQCEPVRRLRSSHSICSTPLQWGSCATDEAGKQCDVLGKKDLLFRRGFACQALCCHWFLITHHEINAHLYFSAPRKAKRNTTQGWSDKSRWVEVWNCLVSRPHFTFSSRCAPVQWQLRDPRLIVRWCTVLQEFSKLQTHTAGVCALAIGTSPHSDRHPPFCSNPFYTSSPDDKSHFPYRHSEKERCEKQLKRRWWVEHLSPSHCSPSRIYCM